MRRGMFRAAVAAVAVAMVAVPAAAQADTTGPWTPVTDPLGACNDGNGCSKQSLDLPAGVFCPFNVQVKVVSNDEMQQTTTLSDGTTVKNVQGNLVVSFQNQSTGKATTRDESGPYTITTDTRGEGTWDGTGDNFFIFGPHSQANTGLPGLNFTTGDTSTTGGAVHLTFSTENFGTPEAKRVVNTFNWSGGTPINGCTLLAGL